MVNPAPSFPHFNVEVVKKVNSKPDFKNEKKYQEQRRLTDSKNDRELQRLSPKGKKVDLLL